MPFTPEFRAALTAAAAGMFCFVAGVSLTASPYRVVAYAATATGVLLLAVAFPRLWRALPGLPTGRINPPVMTPRTAPVDLFADLPGVAVPPPGVDPHTGEVVGDRVDRLAATVEALRAIVEEQSVLAARGYAALREEIARGR